MAYNPAIRKIRDPLGQAEKTDISRDEDGQAVFLSVRSSGDITNFRCLESRHKPLSPAQRLIQKAHIANEYGRFRQGTARFFRQ
jgi:hypothetical protein